MPADPIDEDLMRIFGVDADDLHQNQRGKLSLQQRIKLLSRVDNFFFIMLVVTPIGMIIMAVDHQPAVNLVGLLALTTVVTLFNRRSFLLLLDVLDGRVVEASGLMSIRLYTYDRRTYAGIMGHGYANGIIGVERFIVPEELADAYQNKALRAFFTPRYRQAVAAQESK